MRFAITVAFVALLIRSQASEIRTIQVGDNLQMALSDCCVGSLDEPPPEKLPSNPISNPIPRVIEGKAYDLKPYLSRLGVDAGAVDLLIHFPDRGLVVIRGTRAGIERVHAAIRHLQVQPENLRIEMSLWRDTNGERIKVCGFTGLTRSGVKTVTASPQYEAVVTPTLATGDFSIDCLIRFSGRGALEGHLIDTVAVVYAGQEVDVATWEDEDGKSKCVLTFEIEGEALYEKAIGKGELEDLSQKVSVALEGLQYPRADDGK